MYSKKQQTYKKQITHKVCKTCGKKRAIRFFSSKRAFICNDCKRRKWRNDLKSSPGRINKKKDAEWSKKVKERAGFKCEYCGSTQNLNSHHVFSRSNRAVRWDLDNGVCLTAYYHKFNTKFSAHATPTLFTQWIIKKRGQKWHDELAAKARKIK